MNGTGFLFLDYLQLQRVLKLESSLAFFPLVVYVPKICRLSTCRFLIKKSVYSKRTYQKVLGLEWD